MKTNFLFLSLSIMLLFGCDDKNSTNQPQPYEKGIFVLNEGSFGNGNASVSFIDADTKAVSNDIFAAVNGRPLGDVAQSITFWAEYAYIVVNNSQKIEVVEANTFKSVGTIANLPSPRFIQIVSPVKAYVSNIFSSEITIINPTTFAKTGSITVPCSSDCWTEQMYLSGNTLYVANTGNNSVTVINTINDQIVTNIALGKQPTDLAFSAATQSLWAMCLGGFECFPNTCEPASIQSINLSNNSVDKVLAYQTTDNFVSNLQLNNTGNKAMFLNGGVYEASLTSNETSLHNLAQALPIGGSYIYGVRYNDDNYNYGTFVTDAADFAQNGVVYQLSNNGVEVVDTFSVGVAPSKVYFK